MSYTYNNEIKYVDSPNLDSLGRLRTSGITTLLDIKHPFNKLPLLVDEVSSGSSTSTWANSQVTMTTSASNDYVIRQSIKAAPYQSGKSQLFEASFSNFATQTNVTKRVGYFTTNKVAPYNSTFDGFFLESDGTSGISFQIWKGGTNIINIPKSSWLNADYDASLLDWTKTQLMMVDFQWLGVGRMRFYMVVDGTPRLFYEHTGINSLTTVYMNNPNKPVRYEIRQSGVGSGSFGMICAGVAMEGSINELYRPVAVNDFTERTLATGGTTYAMLGIRLNGTTLYEGVSAGLSQIDILQTSNDNFLVTVQKAPTLSGAASWTTVTNTPIQYSAGGGLTVSTPGHIMGSMMGKSGSLQSEKISMEDSVFSLGYLINGTPEEWWICVQAVSTNAKIFTGANIKYYT